MTQFASRRVLAALFVVVAVLSCSSARGSEEAADAKETLELFSDGSSTVYTLPDSMITLSDTTFEGYLFPKKSTTTRAFLAVFYSPWCPHCKTLLPGFINASTQLDLLGIPHSSFAVCDVQKNRKVLEYFQVNKFPLLVYTTGKGRQWHTYEGANTQEAFMQFSAYLQRALDTGSFSEDVTDVTRFNEVEAASGSLRVPCYIYVPRTSPSRPENQRAAPWSQAVDGAASVGNIRFSVIYEATQAEDWADHASGAYGAVVAVAKACVAAGKANGPDGEALVVYTDRYRTPKCFTGVWVEKRKDSPTSDALAMSTKLEYFLALHGFHAVEDAAAAMFDTLTHMPKNYLGVILSPDPIDASDEKFVPVLREITQVENIVLEQQNGGDVSVDAEINAPRVSWAFIDAVNYEVWRTHYAVEVEDLPAIVIIDTKRDRFYKMRTRVPRFEEIKLDTPWRIGGEQQQLIQQFARDVLADVYKAEKLSLAGRFAEFLSHYPGFSFLYEVLNYEDFVFDIVVMVLGFFCFLMFLAIVAEPMSERYTEHQKQQQQPKLKTE
ncbi:putative mitochondrial disulfide isomerase [Leptomonas pyrrhocoris]|uniref:Putative mitochondrial disulfide isomerase n=1 Tax=Leptomonas pyrrhocoris TaxID=157538 RepID=A0A0M9GA34_LEPPY|nr:putative mitochondrial disulfide isomerase [Leptomonas pyrrhocoris]KPA86040.1 putative mitochondrial disulfide isomerase [Leptomonas pyrrhocoris]|eukprot:XP_015664479.1 putative mitochondrial disulfide isomerase [Leptomonas pyrrhocoris]